MIFCYVFELVNSSLVKNVKNIQLNVIEFVFIFVKSGIKLLYMYICFFYFFEVEEGDLVDFICEVVGIFKFYLNWIYNGRQLVDDGKYVIFEEEGVNYLQIYDIILEDVGEYLVQAENDYGKVSCIVDFQVEGEKIKIYNNLFIKFCVNFRKLLN